MNTRTLIILTAILVLLAGFDYLEAWTKPTVAAPNGNVAAPINTSNTTQDKLGVFGAGALGINSNSPRLLFSDMDSNNWWIHTNQTQGGQNNMYFMNDRNDDGQWTGENPWPLLLSTDPTDGTAATDYALFSNQVRANEYCDRLGGNCFKPATGSAGGNINLTVINVETMGDILIANSLCQAAGHDGVWSAMDRNGNENVICFDSPIVNKLPLRLRFVTKYVALVWDPTFYAWAGDTASGLARPTSYGPWTKWYDGFGWHIPQLGIANSNAIAQATADKLCDYFMVNGKADLSQGAFQSNAGTYSVADYGSDNNNTAWYWDTPTNSWKSYPHGSNGSIDLTQVTCTGDSVRSRGQKWLVGNMVNNGTSAHVRCNAFWDKNGTWTNGAQCNSI